MIPAKKNRLFIAWFSHQVERRIQRAFAAVYVRNLRILEDALTVTPVLAISNHTSYWDPMLVMYLGHRRLKADGYAMMMAQHLRRLPFLGRVGGFGFDIDRPKDGLKTVRYAAGLLSEPKRLVWIFPQGQEYPRAQSIDNFKMGAAKIAALAHQCTVVPVAFRYEFRGLEKPEVFISIGDPIVGSDDLNASRLAQQEAVKLELQRIDQTLVEPSSSDSFEPLMYTGPNRLDRVAESLLARLTRYPMDGHPRANQ